MLKPLLFGFLLHLVPCKLLADGSQTAPISQSAHSTYKVQGRKLYDPCGEEILLRGINEMFVYMPPSRRLEILPEIAKTGANTIRIVWNTKVKDPQSLSEILERSLALQMLPIPELHDATGRWEKLPELIDYWLSPEMLPILLRYQDRILINLGNEVGDHTVTAEQWLGAWSSAVQRIRAAGIRAPLIIDAPKWGQDIDRLQASGPALIQADPLRNLILSVHTWWPDGQAETLARELTESVRLDLPLLIGEFGPYAVYQCPQFPVDYHSLMTLTHVLEIGWLAWSWGGIPNRDCPGLFDMTQDGNFESLKGWGWEVVHGHPNGLKKTALRTRFLQTGQCHLSPQLSEANRAR